MKKILIITLTILTISCNQNKKEEKIETNTKKEEVKKDYEIRPSVSNPFVSAIENAHKKNLFLKHKSVSFSIDIKFGGKQRLNAKITMLTNTTKIRIDKKDGATLVYDGQDIFISPKDADDKRARFDMFTWTYFFGFPYKLNDPGTKWEVQKNRTLDNISYNTAKLSFDTGIGDSPDDWYVLYADPNTNLLKASAYIVTYGSNGDTAKAESDPHAIYYKSFKTINNIPFATKWEFYGWRSEKGFTDKLGEASISNITFSEDENMTFRNPENYKKLN